MLFEIAQIPLMIEDLYDRQVTLWLCVIVLVIAIFQGGMMAAYGAILGTILTYPCVSKNYLGCIDGVFLGVYLGLLQDLNKIAIFFMIIGFLGMVWHYVKRTPAPCIFLMGLSYLLV